MSAGGLYVHIPFCATVCPYCDFAVVAGRRSSHEAYLAALLTEARAVGPLTATSIFIGGGTPSFVSASLLSDTLRSLRALFGGTDAECTVEVNPESASVETLRALADAGVNRVSIGAQSFDPVVLRALGRAHTPSAIADAVAAARAAGIDNVSLDLIYGTAEETDASWEASLRAAVALRPEHLSCYSLQIEEGTPFGTAVARGAMAEPDEDALATRFEVASAVLGSEGLAHYEVSNWALPGRASQHNMTYWAQGDYVGLGLGAHSHRAGHRWWNTRDLSAYLADPARARAGEEHLTDAERAQEWVMLRVRLTEGVPLGEAAARLGYPLPVDDVIAAGLGVIDDGTLRLTPRGLLLGNRVAAMLAA